MLQTRQKSFVSVAPVEAQDDVTMYKSTTSMDIKVTKNVSAEAAGSVLYEMGNTRILAVINPPAPSEGAIDGRFSVSITVGGDPAPSLARTAADALRPSIQFTKYPKCDLTASVHVLCGSDDLLPAAINSLSLALCFAGISLFGVVTAATVGAEEEVPVTVAAMAGLGHVTMVSTTGTMGLQELDKATTAAVGRCGAIQKSFTRFLTE
ncbi:3' exoribonuclease family domain 1 [Carpediemonas membranifera]|uniref:3' exoribonuclease family domain 1 n=1 Tax=Carpediemonas membranifera TaxID=201153 RepID=A0A8J6E2P2_9EUKA|nr:3' exoribonuclease family domain 1 [Carpediemonas membranifera]|eukprot:KAG9392137.1 3' exoribonuclease family domain 1 [Carpediemonas membranifera]